MTQETLNHNGSAKYHVRTKHHHTLYSIRRGKYLEVSDRRATAIQCVLHGFDNGTPDADSSDGESAIVAVRA